MWKYGLSIVLLCTGLAVSLAQASGGNTPARAYGLDPDRGGRELMVAAPSARDSVVCEARKKVAKKK